MSSDEELMVAAAQGDLAAFEQIVLRHQRTAWAVAHRFLGDSAEAEDAAQDAFLKILAAAPRYRPSAAFRTFLIRVVSRLCMDRARTMRPAKTRREQRHVLLQRQEARVPEAGEPEGQAPGLFNRTDRS